MSDRLAEPQKRAWVALLLAHSAAHRTIDAALRAEGRPSLEVYDVLLALEEAPGQAMRMVDLADAVVYSPSGLTRLIDRMEKAGLVERRACPGDRRAVHIGITPDGLRARSEAWPRYAELIQAQFGRFLSEKGATALATELERVIDGQQVRRGCPST